MLGLYLCLGLLLGLSPTIATAFTGSQTQILLQSNSESFGKSNAKRAITAELSEFITGLIDASNIPGISLGVVHTSYDGEKPHIELKSWGRKTEDGDGNDLTSGVSLISSSQVMFVLWTLAFSLVRGPPLALYAPKPVFYPDGLATQLLLFLTWSHCVIGLWQCMLIALSLFSTSRHARKLFWLVPLASS